MTNSELAALELQARIMGWEPAVTEDVVIEVPGTQVVYCDEAMVRLIAKVFVGALVNLDRSEY